MLNLLGILTLVNALIVGTLAFTRAGIGNKCLNLTTNSAVAFATA